MTFSHSSALEPTASSWYGRFSTLRGVLDDYSYANPTMSNRVLERSACIVEALRASFHRQSTSRVGTPSSATSKLPPARTSTSRSAYFAQRGKEIILLLIGGNKSSQQRDIKKAIEINVQYE